MYKLGGKFETKNFKMCDSIFDFNKIVFLSFLLHLDVVLPQQVYCFMSTSVIT